MDHIDPTERLLWDMSIASEIDFGDTTTTADRLPGESVRGSVMRKLRRAKGIG